MKFDPVSICRVLSERGVKFVVLGGFATVIHGSPVPTEDIDVIPSRDMDNLERLASALQEMNAAIRTSDGPVHTRIDAGFIASMPNMLNLVTDFGDMDLVFNPAGRLVNYEQWNKGRRTHRSSRAWLLPSLLLMTSSPQSLRQIE